MLEISNETDDIFEYELFNKIADFLSPRNVELILTYDEELLDLNLKFRSQNKTTDVLSFPFGDMGIVGVDLPLGSVVINVDMAKRVAKELGHSIDFEIALLLAHGILHLLGYDHEIDNGEHRCKEEEVMHFFGLPKSLIVRNDP
ncbi:rRNA maturation RNase YbeY [Helicobacter sp. 12S02232-10]|uniref:rRNA maturation RNase YbeY n=1 Tax=Helicobacter sp. 12S02232-10 TaxID=1476197 RepID=UPI000BA6CBEF|nr:rRNA maturation RNase YbeY [Helicobacter sp. 12S02232-10]PAF49572.1 rRNA maturation RNase YbeY [Helicobacter sp. 12S02232-10]